MRNSSDGAAGVGGLEQRTYRKANKNEASRRGKMNVDFGCCFAYKDDNAQLGKSS